MVGTGVGGGMVASKVESRNTEIELVVALTTRAVLPSGLTEMLRAPARPRTWPSSPSCIVSCVDDARTRGCIVVFFALHVALT